METVDVIIIGSGQGGIPLAVDLAKEGRKVFLFERDALGGSCVNYGCTPLKPSWRQPMPQDVLAKQTN